MRHSTTHLIAALLFLGVASAPPAQAQDAVDMVGPLVGHVTASSAALWMYAGKEAKIEVLYQVDALAAKPRRAAFAPIAEPAADMLQGRAAKAMLDNLAPNTKYQFQIAIDGQGLPEGGGKFKTPPAAGQPCKFRLGLTSCMKIGQKPDSWKLFLDDAPDLHVTLGDTHYADTTEPNTQWRHHLRYRQVPQFAAVLRNAPTLAMWDDHDYGPNDSDGTAKGKEQSLISWSQVWANPPLGTEETPGAFFKSSWGDVDLFLVDGRYHRSPDRAADDDAKRMLGDAQFAWLLEGLNNSTAKFKVIASGSTLDHSGGDGWKIYTFSRHRLFKAIKENGIDGVVYMSGDIHRSLVWEHHESEMVGYPLVEVISSGIANSAALSYATIDFDTTVDDPTMRVRIVLGDGKVGDDRTWKLSQLGGEKTE